MPYSSPYIRSRALDVLKLTPLRIANVPPPMALTEIKLSQPIIDVSFLHSDSDPIMLAVLHRTELSLIHWPLNGSHVTLPTVMATKSHFVSSRIPCKVSPDSWLLQVCFLDPHTVFLLGVDQEGTFLSKVHFEAQELRLVSVIRKPLIKEISSSHPAQSALLCLWLTNNTLLGIENQADQWEADGLCMAKLPENTERVEVWSSQTNLNHGVNGVMRSDRHPAAVFSLSKNGSLQAGSTCLAKQCTSLITTPTNLIFTTSQHLVKLVHLGKTTGER